MTQNDEPFLSRWSRRKGDARTEKANPVPGTDEVPPSGIDALEAGQKPGPVMHDGEAPDTPHALTEADFADVDFDTLSYDSEYGRFMQAGVPEGIRQKALRKLWESDPIFTQVDPFQDYAGDYTDKAVAVPGVAIKTAYQYGRGFLSDEDVAAWDKLGKPGGDTKQARTAVATITIKPETPDQPEVLAFLAASDAYAASLYPAESNHLVDIATLMTPDIRFLVARSSARAIGCGAILIRRDADAATGEIKRMWVDPAARGQKAGARILAALEETARAERLSAMRLETGISQPEALALYRKAGFFERGPFGGYKPDPLSVFMEKLLA
jgi:putative acetyltransferase